MILSDHIDTHDLLLSLKFLRAGAVGINLTQANRVFLMEPGFNPALEAQAIGRVHRLGQKRNVEICRLVIKDSFESRMVQFLKKKYKLTFDDADEGTTVRNDGDVGAEKHDVDGVPKKAKAVADVPGLVGNLQTERAQVVTEEFDELFGVQDRIGSTEPEEITPAEPMEEDDDDFFPDAAMSGSV